MREYLVKNGFSKIAQTFDQMRCFFERLGFADVAEQLQHGPLGSRDENFRPPAGQRLKPQRLGHRVVEKACDLEMNVETRGEPSWQPYGSQGPERQFFFDWQVVSYTPPSEGRLASDMQAGDTRRQINEGAVARQFAAWCQVCVPAKTAKPAVAGQPCRVPLANPEFV